jgi:hypothetical protein
MGLHVSFKVILRPTVSRQSVLVSSCHPGPATNFSFTSLENILTFEGLLLCGALPDERTGLKFTRTIATES